MPMQKPTTDDEVIPWNTTSGNTPNATRVRRYAVVGNDPEINNDFVRQYIYGVKTRERAEHHMEVARKFGWTKLEIVEHTSVIY
jgi:hypothetical protein